MLVDGDSCSCLFSVSLLYGVCEPGAGRSQVCRFAVNTICVSTVVSGIQEMTSPLSSLAKIRSSITLHLLLLMWVSSGAPCPSYGAQFSLQSGTTPDLPLCCCPQVWVSLPLPLPLGSSSPDAVCVAALSFLAVHTFLLLYTLAVIPNFVPRRFTRCKHRSSALHPYQNHWGLEASDARLQIHLSFTSGI